MTDEEKHQQIGRLMSEHKDADQSVARLEAEAKRLAEQFRELSDRLAHDPGLVAGDGMPLDIRWDLRRRLIVKKDWLDLDRVVGVTQEYRKQVERRDALDEQLKRLGFDVGSGL
jgi:hypothetical protein